MVHYALDVTNAPPKQRAPHPVLAQCHEGLLKFFGNMVNQGIIRPLASPWALSVLLVTKKDYYSRLHVDHRKLNEVTKKDSFLLPGTNDTLDSLAGSMLFSTLDLASWYR